MKKLFIAITGIITMPPESEAQTIRNNAVAKRDHKRMKKVVFSFLFLLFASWINNLQAQTITTGSLSSNSFCSGANISVPYTVSGSFVNNFFKAQISDANGVFPNDLTLNILGSQLGALSGILNNCIIPANTPGGTGYRIRVVSTNPPVTGSNNGSNITIIAAQLPSISAKVNGSIAPAAVTLGDVVTFTANPSAGVYCTGNDSLVYAWRSGAGGNDYWNGTSFTGNYTNFRNIYSSINAPIVTAGNYTGYVKCSSTDVFIEATGGTITTLGNYKLHTFTSSGTFQVTNGKAPVASLLVGGGGGSGGWGWYYHPNIGQWNTGSGGGGGGQVVYTTPGPNYTPGSYAVTVAAVVPGSFGSGGSPSANSSGFKGGKSKLATPGWTIIANGGIGGGGGTGNTNGGIDYAPGGHGEVTYGGPVGNGADGTQNSITGVATYYGGGGGGAASASTNCGIGGLGGGGNGRSISCGQTTPGTNGLGGGGGGVHGNGWPGSDGGSGVVIVKYLYDGCSIGKSSVAISIASCAAPAVTAKANGTAGTKSVCPGSVITLKANPSGGIGCTGGNWEYAWTNDGGITYWNGSSFNGGVIYSSTYSTISFTVSNVNSSYSCIVRCANNAGCSNVSSVTVNLKAAPSAVVTPVGSTSFCAGDSVLLVANSGTLLTYKWKKGNSYILPLKTSLIYYASSAGTYKVEVTNSNGCKKVSAGIVVTNPCRVGQRQGQELNEVASLNSELFPNPTTGSATLRFTSTSTDSYEIKITDITGKQVLALNGNATLGINELPVDLSKYEKGIYFLNIITSEGVQMKKLIKQ